MKQMGLLCQPIEMKEEMKAKQSKANASNIFPLRWNVLHHTWHSNSYFSAIQNY
jgi:hypothetical protein